LTQIFFYHNAPDRIASAAALIGKAFMQKKALLVFAPDRELADGLDRHLWMHPPTGFVAHVRASSPLAGETPVLITDDLEAPAQHERLFNLSDEVPPGFSRFTSVVEVVGRAEQERLAGRERARFYKDRGYAIKFIDLAEAQ
jgi:DNA polymerase-3 subunit chi